MYWLIVYNKDQGRLLSEGIKKRNTGHYTSLCPCVHACSCVCRELYEYEMPCTAMMTQLWFFKKALMSKSARENRPRFHRPAPTAQPSKEIWAQRFPPVASRRNPLLPPACLFTFIFVSPRQHKPSRWQEISSLLPAPSALIHLLLCFSKS